MEIRTLRYFLAAAREENMTRAADDLIGLPLFCSEQGWRRDIPGWCGEKMDKPRLLEALSENLA